MQRRRLLRFDRTAPHDLRGRARRLHDHRTVHHERGRKVSREDRDQGGRELGHDVIPITGSIDV